MSAGTPCFVGNSLLAYLTSRAAGWKYHFVYRACNKKATVIHVSTAAHKCLPLNTMINSCSLKNCFGWNIVILILFLALMYRKFAKQIQIDFSFLMKRHLRFHAIPLLHSGDVRTHSIVSPLIHWNAFPSSFKLFIRVAYEVEQHRSEPVRPCMCWISVACFGWWIEQRYSLNSGKALE